MVRLFKQNEEKRHKYVTREKKMHKEQEKEKYTTYLFHSLSRQHKRVLFLHADTVFDPDVQASEVGRIVG